jgi:hypothetical protein
MVVMLGDQWYSDCFTQQRGYNVYGECAAFAGVLCSAAVFLGCVFGYV